MPGTSVMPGAPGLLSQTGPNSAHKDATKHLYHATKPPVCPISEEQEADLRADGYQDEPILQDYPKFLPDLNATARDAAHEAELTGTKVKTGKGGK